MNTTIIHLSDLHIGHGPEFPPSEETENNLAFIVQSLIDQFDVAPRPVIVITGDLVNDGTTRQFHSVKKILRPLYRAGFIVLPIPGNHDYGVIGNHSWKKRFSRFKNVFFGMDNPHFPLENITYPFTQKIHGHYFIGLNSLKTETPGCDRWLDHGELGDRQLNDLKGIIHRLSTRTDDLKIKEKVVVYLHHHPFVFPHDVRRMAIKKHEQCAYYLKDGDELMELISGNVDILLFGHGHEHINFSNTFLAGDNEFGIPVILACGKSTEDAKETFVDYAANVTERETDDNLLGWRLDIDDHGQMAVESINFQM